MEITDYVAQLVEKNGSDIHLKAGGPAFVRIDGDLVPLAAMPPLSQEDTERFAFSIMDDRLAATFTETNEADFALSEPGVGRFRVNIFRQRGTVGIVMRRVLPGAPDFESLGLPPAVRKLAEEHRGLVLVTGPAGSGKTTTTAAMIGHVNRTRRCHIVTIEDPIEVLHLDDRAIVDQREVGVDTSGFATALRAVARQDPDVIFIGEMRDEETVQAALSSAETGHLVISTLHTTDARETVNRVIDFFPPHQQPQVRHVLSQVLKGVVSQRLVPHASGDGRAAAVEVLVMTSRIADFVADPDQTNLITDAIAEGEYYGMQSFDQHLLELFRKGEIALGDALAASTSPHDLRVAIRAAGLAG
ncbi:MAG: type IV pilus twitching motility protein PilT [Nitriliruptorales bacterium]